MLAISALLFDLVGAGTADHVAPYAGRDGRQRDQRNAGGGAIVGHSAQREGRGEVHLEPQGGSLMSLYRDGDGDGVSEPGHRRGRRPRTRSAAGAGPHGLRMCASASRRAFGRATRATRAPAQPARRPDPLQSLGHGVVRPSGHLDAGLDLSHRRPALLSRCACSGAPARSRYCATTWRPRSGSSRRALTRSPRCSILLPAWVPSAVITTVGTEQEANELAEELLGRRLAACVNILSGVRSVYRWQGRICKDSEYMLVIKSMEEEVAGSRRPSGTPQLRASRDAGDSRSARRGQTSCPGSPSVSTRAAGRRRPTTSRARPAA